MSNDIYSTVQEVCNKYATRNPFELLKDIHVKVFFSTFLSKDGLQGSSGIYFGMKYVLINSNLSYEEQRVVACHEAAHHILHSSTMRDAKSLGKLISILEPSGRLEREANEFTADFLITDEQMMDFIECDGATVSYTAGELAVPQELVLIKLHSMQERGYEGIDVPLLTDNCFLGR